MNKYQKYTVTFTMIGTSFLAAGIGFKDVVDYAILLGWGLCMIAHMVALIYAIKWQKNMPRTRN